MWNGQSPFETKRQFNKIWCNKIWKYLVIYLHLNETVIKKIDDN